MAKQVDHSTCVRHVEVDGGACLLHELTGEIVRLPAEFRGYSLAFQEGQAVLVSSDGRGVVWCAGFLGKVAYSSPRAGFGDEQVFIKDVRSGEKSWCSSLRYDLQAAVFSHALPNMMGRGFEFKTEVY